MKVKNYCRKCEKRLAIDEIEVNHGKLFCPHCHSILTWE